MTPPHGASLRCVVPHLHDWRALALNS